MINQSNISYHNFRKGSILLVEDNADHAEIIQVAAKESMPETSMVTVSSAADAISFLDNIVRSNGVLPKFVLLDLYLSKREDGWMVLQKIKKRPSPLAVLPVIVLSSSEHQQDIHDAYAFGSTAYTIKPQDFPSWISYFTNLRHHWMETVALPIQ